MEDADRAFHHILAIWDDCSFFGFKDAFLRKTEEPIIIITRPTYVRPIQPQLYIVMSTLAVIVAGCLVLVVGYVMTILNDITFI